ncbi:MAG: winged helix-turn-helix transcriptional regulator [Nanoarchaeota archaeon]|nr:winged helix-turn-helix transcriptional regulator [Nanoarchaeota archaeon]
MIAKLDKIDRKIVYELSKNARTSSENIAKRISLSRQVVGYRIKRLEKIGIIKKFRISVNYSAFGYSLCIICLSMKNFKAKDEEEFINFLENNPNVVWVGAISGNWDFLVYIYYKNIKHLDKILQEITSFKKDNLNDVEIMPVIKNCCLNPLIGDLKQDLKETTSKYQRDRGSFESLIRKRDDSEEKIILDHKDIKILDMLDENSAASLTEIAKKLNTNKDTISYRIKRLIRAGIIENFIIVIDMEKLGFQRYMILFELNFDEQEERIISYLSDHKTVHFVAKILGRKNLLVELYCKSIEEFNKSLMEMRNAMVNSLKTYNIIQVFREIKPYKMLKKELNLVQ